MSYLIGVIIMADVTVLNLGKTPTRTVLKLSWPAIVEQFLISMASLIDTAMVGSLGPNATAAVAINISTIWLLEGLSTALSAGFMYVVAHSLGERNTHYAKRAVRQSITSALILGTAIMLLVELIAPFLCIWLGGEKAIYSSARSYLTIIGFGAIFKSLTIVLSSVLRAAGNTKTPLRINIAANLINIIGNFMLIYSTRQIVIGQHSFNVWGAGLGVSGAATSTAFSQFVSGMLLLTALYRVNTPIKLKIKGDYRLSKKLISKVISISIPVAMERVTICLGQIVLTRIISSVGTIALAVHQLVNQCESMMYLPAYGFAASGTTLIGQSIGASDMKKADEFAKILFIVNTIFIACLCIPIFIFARQIMTLFTPSAETIALGDIALKITAATEVLFSLTVVMGGICRGSGDVKFPLFLSLGGMWIIRLLPAYIFANVLGFGVIGVETAIGIDVSIRGLICIIRLKSGKWKPKFQQTA